MGRLIGRALAYYWRTNLAVVLGVATAVAVLAGALLVGDSVRGSLRDLVLQRLGRADLAVVSSGFFRETVAADIRTDQAFSTPFENIAPIVVLPGMVTDQSSGRRTSNVQVYGVDDRFWRFHGIAGVNGPSGRDALVNRTLARDIGAAVGRSILLRVERPSSIPIESLQGRKDNLGRTVRLTVAGIAGAAAGGDFSLQPQQGDVRTIFVPLRRLQQDLEVAGRVNALIVAARREWSGGRGLSALQDVVRRRFALEDVGLTVRMVSAPQAAATTLAVESTSGLLDTIRAGAVDAAAADADLHVQPVLTYLANSLRSDAGQIPYSLVTATDLRTIAPDAAIDQAANPSPIVLNTWAARDLAARAGEFVTMDYYVWEDPGRLVTRTAGFQIAAVVPIEGAAADRTLAPVYPGITEARTLGEWDPPFPIDLKRVRRIDEEYWDKYRTTPKAFVPLQAGQRLWRSRFGDRTSDRLHPPDTSAAPVDAQRFAASLRARIDPLALGVAVRDVRAGGLAASRGATDFGEYFTYFSFFLVVSALMLAALFFRLGIEQRAKEIGLLRSVGFSDAIVRRLFVAEGVVLASCGALVGVAGAVGYAAGMMAGLRSWWSGAVGTRALTLHVTSTSLVAGAAGALAAAVLCIWWTLRVMSRVSERALLAGALVHAGPSPVSVPDRSRRGGHYRARRRLSRAVTNRSAVFVFLLLGAVLLALSFSGTIDRTGGFFGAGSSLLVASLCGVAFRLRRPQPSSLHGSGWKPVWSVGLRNAADRPGRSVLAIGVIASATFILIAVGAFRRSAAAPTDRHSGTGGYQLLVNLLLPLATDPNGRDGREALGIGESDAIAVEGLHVLPGDDASCLNLYQPRNPRVLGVSRRFIEANRFAFQASAASTGAEHANPWLLLNRELGSDVVPVIGDANSITYVLHKQIGDDVVVVRGDRPLRLRIVAALSDSIFQGELLMADARFTRLFPEVEGYRLLLVEAPGDRAARIAAAVEEQAGDLGADAVGTAERLAEFHAVENTYLSTFQTLGGLGLLVGTIGLAAVVLRNVLERRRELALLGAVGYGRRHIFTIVVAENLLLLGWGLAIGTACALLAIAPAAFEHGGHVPIASSLWLLGAVFVAGLLSSVVATRAALATPMLAALRSE